jgi:hypothetical protein
MQGLRDSDPRSLAAGASDYLRLFALVTMGWMALELARADRTGQRARLAQFYLRRSKAEAVMLAERSAADTSTLAAVEL